VAALRSTGSDTYRKATADFRAVWDLHGQGFTRGVLNEANFRSDVQASAELRSLSHLAKAFWVTLYRPDWVANAKVLSDVDRLPAGAWIKRRNLPARAGEVHEHLVEQLQEDLITFFTKTQHRGSSCKIECLRFGDDEIFYTYAEDHPDTNVFWLDGELQSHVLSPNFCLIFDTTMAIERLRSTLRTIRPSYPISNRSLAAS
jgi:hypothetical protein